MTTGRINQIATRSRHVHAPWREARVVWLVGHRVSNRAPTLGRVAPFPRVRVRRDRARSQTGRLRRRVALSFAEPNLVRGRVSTGPSSRVRALDVADLRAPLDRFTVGLLAGDARASQPGSRFCACDNCSHVDSVFKGRGGRPDGALPCGNVTSDGPTHFGWKCHVGRSYAFRVEM